MGGGDASYNEQQQLNENTKEKSDANGVKH